MGSMAHLDTNSWPALLISGIVEPVRGLELRGAVKRGGDTGSKVERLPNFFAGKRNDNAWILSVRYEPVRYASVFGELARFTWGLPETSADLLGFGYAPLHKDGYYVGGELFYPLSGQLTIGIVVTREELSRGRFTGPAHGAAGPFRCAAGQVGAGQACIASIWGVSDLVRVGVYRNNLSNPYPWLSGIVPVDGEGAFGRLRGSNKWGVTLAFQLR